MFQHQSAKLCRMRTQTAQSTVLFLCAGWLGKLLRRVNVNPGFVAPEPERRQQSRAPECPA